MSLMMNPRSDIILANDSSRFFHSSGVNWASFWPTCSSPLLYPDSEASSAAVGTLLLHGLLQLLAELLLLGRAGAGDVTVLFGERLPALALANGLVHVDDVGCFLPLADDGEPSG